LVSVHCHAHRFASVSYYTAADLYNMLYETAKALSCNYGNVLLFHRFDQLAWRCIRLQRRKKHQTTMKTISSAVAAAARMQNKVVVE